MTTDTPTSMKALEADIAMRRERLAATIDELAERAAPRAIVERQVESAKASFASATTNPDGSVRMDRVAVAVLAVAALVAIRVLRRRRR